ncbi:hypothetical protein VTK26DRAFT_1489 [Humicola hyalothermophila]
MQSAESFLLRLFGIISGLNRVIHCLASDVTCASLIPSREILHSDRFEFWTGHACSYHLILKSAVIATSEELRSSSPHHTRFESSTLAGVRYIVRETQESPSSEAERW